ncbi:MAG: putative metalloprotease CJM1_0395 family protein [Halopseudomonas sp.]
MNIVGTNTSLNALSQSQTATSSQSGQLDSSKSPVLPQTSSITTSDAQRPDSALTVNRVNDPLQPSQARAVDNNSQKPRSDQPAASSASAAGPSSQLFAQPNQSEQQVQAQVRQLAQIDREVRDHEAAHAAAGGGLAGAPSYSYTRGPDGQLYATAGEVDIDTSRSADPATSIQNARTVLQAALAPANPSSQDLRVAAQARAQLIDAQAVLARNEQQALNEGRDSVSVEQTGQEQALAADEAKEEVKKEQAPDNELLQQQQDELQQRQVRIQQQQSEFAQELVELNQRIQLIQQQLVDTGQVDPGSLLQGTLVDTQA